MNVDAALVVLARRALWARVWPGRDGLWATLDE